MAEEKKATGDPSGGNDSPGAGQKDPKVKSSTPENSEGKLNPSAPGETGTTPGSNEIKK